jgi:hypothetical protein
VGTDGGEGDEEKCEGYFADHAFSPEERYGKLETPRLSQKTRRRCGMSQKTTKND